jgi:hypothetical protein
MLLFRLLTTGVCVACVVMLATIRPVRVVQMAPMIPPPNEALREDRAPPVSVVDVANGVAPEGLASLVHLRPTEWVIAINDRAVDTDLPLEALFASLVPRAGEFIDLTVTSAAGERRVLILLH